MIFSLLNACVFLGEQGRRCVARLNIVALPSALDSPFDLFFKSGYIPRGLAAFGVIVSAWAGVCTLALIFSPDFAKLVNLWWFDTGLRLFELATGFWLVIKGLSPGMTPADPARAGVTA